MTVKEMIEVLKKENPDAICVVPFRDHAYRIVGRPGHDTAVEGNRGRYDLSEYTGNDADYDDVPKKSAVVIFGG